MLIFYLFLVLAVGPYLTVWYCLRCEAEIEYKQMRAELSKQCGNKNVPARTLEVLEEEMLRAAYRMVSAKWWLFTGVWREVVKPVYGWFRGRVIRQEKPTYLIDAKKYKERTKP